MATLDSLPLDQRAVLQMVLQQGRSYDDIASLLSIERAAVRKRALEAFNALGPSNSIPAPQRALLTDYLLGQLPPAIAAEVREQLGTTPPGRAWARVVSAQISSLARGPLPEIPVGSAWHAEPPDEPEPETLTQSASDDEPEQFLDEEPEWELEPAPGAAAGSAAGLDEHDQGWAWPSAEDLLGQDAAAGDEHWDSPEAHAAPPPPPPEEPRRRRIPSGPGELPGSAPTSSIPPPRPRRQDARRNPARTRSSNRRGGAILLIAAAIAVLAVVLIIIFTSGGGTPASHRSTTKTGSGTTSTPATTSTPSSTTTTATTPTKILSQINLLPPAGASKAAGTAWVVLTSGTLKILILATGMPANNPTNNPYGVWLYNSPSSEDFLGFDHAAVGSGGKLEIESRAVAPSVRVYKQLLITVETVRQPKTPGQVVLKGAFTLGPTAS